MSKSLSSAAVDTKFGRILVGEVTDGEGQLSPDIVATLIATGCSSEDLEYLGNELGINEREESWTNDN